MYVPNLNEAAIIALVVGGFVQWLNHMIPW
jgi:hypothetical protein